MSLRSVSATDAPAARTRRRAAVPAIAAATACALTLALSACGSDEDDDTAATETSATGCAAESTSGRSDVDPIPVAPAKITVTDPGAQPRKIPAAAPERATPQTTTVSVTSTAVSRTVQDGIDDRRQTVNIPLTARFGCQDSTDVEMTLATPTSPDPTLDEQLAEAEGGRAGMAVGPGIMPISLRLLPTGSSGPEARHAIEQSLVQALQVSVALPTVPVGVGAVWTSQRSISGAVTVTQVMTITLTSWTGNRVVLGVTLEETPINSVFAVPGTSETITLRRYSNEGTGTVTVDLGRALPDHAALTLTGARELVGSDESAPIVQRTGATVNWRAR
ncbi:hypothetical protein [Gordonia sp. (in: high G+C Gram-positive bacteria)]|uniref:hypothetical protein n=1 Tax=Gordonia sp. (in: high G+C Gram-positive bacteria) TaxID=84139 RepID=UPI00257B1B7F|nr:hypothetical protein [Gordonia sp. (in: high G+C Gram-positive bacteria)]